jgi:hypothetical protein
MLSYQFADSSKIKIINNIPYYSLDGKSYLERLKNGLSLDIVFAIEDGFYQEKHKNIINEEKNKQLEILNYKLYDKKYDYDINIHNKKGKKYNKKLYSRNMKKNKIRQNGYNDKLYFIETNLPSIFDHEFDLQYYPDDLNNSIDDYSDDYIRDYYEDNYYEDNYSIMSIDSYNNYYEPDYW